MRFCAQNQLLVDPPSKLPDGWQCQPGLPLDAALPFPWDADYRERFGQPFQPVRFWQNACALSSELQRRRASGGGVEPVEALLLQLVERMRGYLRSTGSVDLVENRFAFREAGMHLAHGWVGGLSNAFVILGCHAMAPVLRGLGLEGDVRRLANGFLKTCREGDPPPARWISYVDRNAYLWFEEYPEAGGRANLVLNGHVFCVFALYRAAGLWPGHGYDRLAQAGATTVAAYIPQFRRKGKVNLYALRGTRRSDYLPMRTIRQQYQMYLLTGLDVFLRHARAFRSDMAGLVSAAEAAQFDRIEATAIRRRAFIDAPDSGVLSRFEALAEEQSPPLP
jgi:hypothetical protein